MPTETSTCPQCGSRITPERSGGFCAVCALDDAMFEPANNFDGHELLGEIARGGMGVIYRARQRDPEREVALKTLLGAGFESASAHERFRIEAQAMASLVHPAILPVYTCGEQDGIPFFTMQLATGGTLTQRAAQYDGRWRAIAELLANIADAVQFAHEHGVLHRDLKPGNILFDDAGRAFVTDFGLAKLMEDPAHLTGTAALLGTPAYLAPELTAKDAQVATTASDVWGLGAMLYELLGQRAAFQAESTAGLLRRIAEDEPPPLARETPQDLSVIAFKALAKDPARRYASAREMAEDLRLWLAGRPILARPATALELLAAWARRHPGLAISLAVLAVAFLIFGVVERKSINRLRRALAQTQLREVRLQRQSGQAGQRFDSLKTLTQLARAWPRSDAATLRTEIAATLALPDLRQTRRWTAPHVAVNGTEAFSDDLRFYAAAVEAGIALFETRSQKLVRVWLHPRASAAHELVFSPTAAWLGVRFDDNHWELFATGSERPPVQASAPVAFHSDGQGFFTVREGEGLFLVTLADEKERRILPPPVLLDPLLPDRSGERVLVLVGKPPRAVIVRASDGAQLVNIPTIPDLITAADWSADGRWIALANGVPPYTVTLYDAGSGEQSARFNEHPMAVRKLRFHPDSRSFAAVSDGQKLIWRSVEPSGFRVAIEAGARALEFSLDGRQLGYSPEQGQLGLLEITEPAIFRAWDEPPPDGTGTAYSAALSPDGRWAAVASDKSLRVWDARARRSVAQQSHPLGRAWWSTVFFAPKDPAQIVWSMLGGGVWRAELNSAGQLSTPRRVGGAIDGLVQEFAADGRSLVVNVQPGPGQRAELWPEGDPARAHLLGSGIPFAGYRVVKEGHTGISTHFSEPDLWLWDTASGKRIRSLGLKEPVASEPSPDGRWLLTGTRSGHVLWNTSTWEAGARWPSRPGERDVWVAAFSPDSRMLAKASPAGEITLRRVPSGEELLTLIPPRGLRLQELKFTADGSHLLMLQASGRFYEWNLKDLRAELDKLALGW